MEDPTLRMYALIRQELDMPAGKLAAQAGHAYLDAFLLTQTRDPPKSQLYQSDGHGTKVTLAASIDDIFRIHELCKMNGLDSALIVDSGHIFPPHFTGDPIVTALGIGPVYRHEVPFLQPFYLI